MLSCLNGALEYYRTTGEPRLLEACRNAWQDIVENRLYITGTASSAEYFRDDHELPNRGNVGETCVTVTWLQFNAQLLRLTGEARFANQLERTVLNQLFGAQQPDCTAWGYYVEMEGWKPYSRTFDANCCLSSGPRGVALLPTFAATTDADGVVVNLYTGTRAQLTLRDGTAVALAIATRYPADGAVRITVQPAQAAKFSVKLRMPEWAHGATATINGRPAELAIGSDDYAALRRKWQAGDTIELRLPLALRVVAGQHTNAGKVAFTYGPLVLAADEARLPAGSLPAIALASADPEKLGLAREPAADGAVVFRAHALRRDPADPLHRTTPVDLDLVPFAEAGGTGGRYQVWLPLLGAPHFNLAPLGAESRSRSAPDSAAHPASLTDGNIYAAVTTEGGPAAAEDWFAVTLPHPAPLARIVFYHGRVAKNGGWFDTSAGQPLVQIQTQAGGPWTTVGPLTAYPATTATGHGPLGWNDRFEFNLPQPVTALAVRVIGRPAGGEKPAEAHASCGELEWYAD